MRAYRVVFGLAALYNAAFGVWASLFPLSFFNLFLLEPPRYPSIWACLGMVVGVYAIAYAYVAWKPEQGDLLIAIGLLGKTLGPLGWLVTVMSGELPPRTFPVILFNDLIWWFPFLIYLLRNHPRRGTIITWWGAGIHAVACVGLILCADGLESQPSVESRWLWIRYHVGLWVVTWFVWSLASMSLIAFAFVWSRELLLRGGAKAAVIIGFALMALGLPFDLAGEWVNVALVTRPQPQHLYAEFAVLYRLLGVAVANGLYCAGGLVLSVAALRIGWLKHRMHNLGFAMWTNGLLLTAFALSDRRMEMVGSGALLMALFIPWSAWVGWRMLAPLDPAESRGV